MPPGPRCPHLFQHRHQRLLAQHLWLVRDRPPHMLLQRVHHVQQALVPERVRDLRVLKSLVIPLANTADLLLDRREAVLLVPVTAVPILARVLLRHHYALLPTKRELEPPAVAVLSPAPLRTLLFVSLCHQEDKLHRRRDCRHDRVSLIVLDCPELPAVLDLDPLDALAVPSLLVPVAKEARLALMLVCRPRLDACRIKVIVDKLEHSLSERRSPGRGLKFEVFPIWQHIQLACSRRRDRGHLACCTVSTPPSPSTTPSCLPRSARHLRA
mmetsp:Transcript_32117/g.88004  ORF Transcript_32117/g.88004 Transcript_32117/m.88004 type:complete len:270 (+) Transcript_32117:440-1249(+)